ncbi:MAG: DUF2309 domain-containing protein [Gammaproteobacteria bacterium]
MQQSSSEPRAGIDNPREFIRKALNHLDHVLPGQAPIHDFVHHNTLHGFQHLPFEEALAAFESLTGTSGYLPESESRKFFRQGRIDERDIEAALMNNPHLEAEREVCRIKDKPIVCKAIYRIALLYDMTPIDASQLDWQIEELEALNSFQQDVPETARSLLLATETSNEQAIGRLWETILTKLDLRQADLHPENLFDLSLEQAENWLARVNKINADSNDVPVHRQMQRQSRKELHALQQQVGDTITLRGFIQALSGIDCLDSVRPLLIRVCASGMDEGMAPWQLPERNALGIYGAWRAALRFDQEPWLQELPDGSRILEALPEDPVDAIIEHLLELDIPASRWEGYLRRLALELPGWAGLLNWRQQHRHYRTHNDAAPNLTDYCAIRLTLDRLWLSQICQEIWQIEAKLGKLSAYFDKNPSEFLVRSHLYRGDLPEYLTRQAEAMAALAGAERFNRTDWRQLADLIWTWQFSPMADRQGGDDRHSIGRSGWRLFRLCQHLGLGAKQIQFLDKKDLLAMLAVLDRFTETERGKVWLCAYEHHYREDFLQALTANHGRGRWQSRESRPEAQAVFCMDEREESFRRHLEELNASVETLGAAGFFGVPMKFKGLDASEWTPLCPVVVTPAHEVVEVARKGTEKRQTKHANGRRFYQHFGYLLQQSLRRNLVLAHALIDVLAPWVLFVLLGKSLFPRIQQNSATGLRKVMVPSVATELALTSDDLDSEATPEHPKAGFTEAEQTDRVAQFLRTIGLTDGFARIVCLMGHGSTSQNNPHEAAHDCGACGGRQGGPNARAFAAMANRGQVRHLLAEQGINIPDDCWFVGGQHDTCSDNIDWYDLDAIPAGLITDFEGFRATLLQARDQAAHERCRRFFSARQPAMPRTALRHVQHRSNDLSQVRPEFGHATNAAALIGRRSATQGLFLDRRVFLISYDPTRDPDGQVLENILLTAGPVGAGINLEYYFSTVNNERFGCGTKIPHNVTGLFGVMEGTSSDLRTGLPKQMIEIHEAMRLQVVVESKTAIVERIYQRQPSLQELIDGGWIHLSALDPDTGAIHIFERGNGFVPWRAEPRALPESATSPDCYRNQSQPIAPVLIRQPLARSA